MLCTTNFVRIWVSCVCILCVYIRVCFLRRRQYRSKLGAFLKLEVECCVCRAPPENMVDGRDVEYSGEYSDSIFGIRIFGIRLTEYSVQPNMRIFGQPNIRSTEYRIHEYSTSLVDGTQNAENKVSQLFLIIHCQKSS